MNNPHKHAALIKAWADGAKIQVRYGHYHWADCEPSWSLDCEYRVKPTPKQVWARCYHTENGMNMADRPRNDFDAAFGPRNWAGPAVLVWEEK